jgi:hypothetical protein
MANFCCTELSGVGCVLVVRMLETTPFRFLSIFILICLVSTLELDETLCRFENAGLIFFLLLLRAGHAILCNFLPIGSLGGLMSAGQAEGIIMFSFFTNSLFNS